MASLLTFLIAAALYEGQEQVGLWKQTIEADNFDQCVAVAFHITHSRPHVIVFEKQLAELDEHARLCCSVYGIEEHRAPV